MTNQLGPLAGVCGASCVLVDLTVHLATVLLCGNQEILAPLKQLAMNPVSMQVCSVLVVDIVIINHQVSTHVKRN